MRYFKTGGLSVEFITIPGKDLKICGGFILFPSQQTFPLYDLAYKSEDSHIYCIAMRSYILNQAKTNFYAEQHILSPSKKAKNHPIDKLIKHYGDFKQNLGIILICFKIHKRI